MKKVTLICVGSIKEKYLNDAINEYKKRIQKFFDLNILEIPESKLLSSQKEIEKALDEEGERILEKAKGKTLVSLCVEGKHVTREELADFVDQKTDMGEVVFVIGSSFGLSKKVKQNSINLSFSKLTFPHQLMRVIFLEQLYRAGTIINNITYPK
jgi:23S rRNA (pseudouridine1915-N3)-methyltransferase